MSGRNSCVTTNQSSSQLPMMPQRVNTMNSLMHNSWKMDADITSMRKKVLQICFRYQEKINHSGEPRREVFDRAKLMEEGFLMEASSKEEYMDNSTLGFRIKNFINYMPSMKPSHRKIHVNSASSTVGTMMPTPGLPQSGTSISATSINPASSTVGIMIPTPGLPQSSTSISATSMNTPAPVIGGTYTDLLLNGYQQSPATNAYVSGGNMTYPVLGSLMIPTPGLTTSKDFSNITPMNVRFSKDEPVVIPEVKRPRQSAGNRSSQITVRSQDVGMRPCLQYKSSYGFSVGAANGNGLIADGNNSQLVNRNALMDDHRNSSSYMNSVKTQQQYLNLSRQLQIFHGDCLTVGGPDIADTESSHESSTVSGLQPKYKPNAALPSQQANLRSVQQATLVKPESIDHSKTKLQVQNHEGQPQKHIQKLQEQYIEQLPHAYLMQLKVHHLNKSPDQQNEGLVDRASQLSSDAQLASSDTQILTEQENLQQSSESYQFSELQNQCLMINIPDYQDNATSLLNSSSSGKLRQLANGEDLYETQLYQQSARLSTEFTAPSTGQLGIPASCEKDVALETTHQTESSDGAQLQGGYQQGITGANEHRLLNSSLIGIVSEQVQLTEDGSRFENSVVPVCKPEKRSVYLVKLARQRWLLSMIHAKECLRFKKVCSGSCYRAQRHWKHMANCCEANCGIPQCNNSKKQIWHFDHCKSLTCPVCPGVRQLISNNKGPVGSCGSSHSPSQKKTTSDANSASHHTSGSPLGSSDDMQSPLKKVKLEHSTPLFTPTNIEMSIVVSSSTKQSKIQTQVENHQIKTCSHPSSKTMEIEVHEASLPQSSEIESESRKEASDIDMVKPEGASKIFKALIANSKKEFGVQIRKEINKVDGNKQLNATVLDHGPGLRCGKAKTKGASLMELFTPEQIMQHKSSLRQWMGQSKAEAEKIQAVENSMNENSCQLCCMERLSFEQPPIYCSISGSRIKDNAFYYTINIDSRYYICVQCYKMSKGDKIEVNGTTILKSKLEKKRNDEKYEEPWVQCDKCNMWHHQVCALFNDRRNDGSTEYTCPDCYIAEIERGERKPLPQSAVLGAKDLPRTILSDHIEQRLFRRLREERQERANSLGKNFDEVAGAEDLVIRVVSSVDKKLEVKSQFSEIFQEENYPAVFPYKSKVILLFKKIQGAEVLLFSVYVQEYGSESPPPNNRRVYLAYLDSVKYFTPEVKTTSGQALRTFIYHELLIGYLEYCKNRGFTSCYIWVCPPLKGEDYILYCHPEMQKTPKSDKLRGWYLAMLKEAETANIVADVTNFYDHFFVSSGECKAKVTAARLSYFDGDYWPGVADGIINQFKQEEDGIKQVKEKVRKTTTKRGLKAAARADLSSSSSKDELLMHKLGKSISTIKANFIMVHLQHPCTHCREPIVSGNRWVCRQCEKFQICDKCYSLEQTIKLTDRHPVDSTEKHALYPVVNDVPQDTADKDGIIENEFFDTRQAFLSLCQGNHYQFDTLRRAKHSSMMVLFHCHNPTAPAFVATCDVCQNDVDAGQGWRCEVCPDYDVCDKCYKSGGVHHPHKLSLPSKAELDAQTQEARQKRVLRRRKMLDLLIHASGCRNAQCMYLSCCKVKDLFRHATTCPIRVPGGCVLCKTTWYLIKVHAGSCVVSNCRLPRCRDMKEHSRRWKLQSEARRRAAMKEMMREEAKEVAGKKS